MAKALDFIDPDKLSMTVVLTAMNRFLNEDNGNRFQLYHLIISVC